MADLFQVSFAPQTGSAGIHAGELHFLERRRHGCRRSLCFVSGKFVGLAVAIGCCLFVSNVCCAAAARKPKPAQIKISGYGLLGNRELRRILTTLELGGKKPEFLGGSFGEDAALILGARIKRDGYLQPTISVLLEIAEGKSLQVEANDLLEHPLPRDLRVRAAHFQIRKGLLYRYERLEFEGLESLSEKEARAYFIEATSLLPLKRTR